MLYCDTDSVVFLKKDNDPPKEKTRDYLGDLTNELEEYGPNSFLKSLCQAVQKTMRFHFTPPRLENAQLNVR